MEQNAYTLREAGLHDFRKNLRNTITGWGAICKARAGITSKSQQRKLRLRENAILRAQQSKSW